MHINETAEIKRLEQELQEKKVKLQNKQAACNHEWTEARYDHEEILKQYCTGEYEGGGVDKWPKTAYRKDRKDRWSRTCLKCGKIEYTYKKKPTKYEPYFE